MPGRKRGAKAAKADNHAADGDKVDAAKVKVEEAPKISSGKKRSKVDPECPKHGNAQIYADDEGAWECMLNQVNIQNNNNKYYLLQVLVDSFGKYFTWFRWGRVGYPGQNKLQNFAGNLEGAKRTFMKKFTDKTKNDWENRDLFVKYPGKYELVEVNIGGDDEASVDHGATDEIDSKDNAKKIKILESELDTKVQELVSMICDVKAMEQTLMGMDFDTNKSPLGKVNDDQIKAGYQALSRIAEIIKPKSDPPPAAAAAGAPAAAGGNRRVKRVSSGASKSSYSRAELLDACNDFYTKIPHSFGFSVPPLITTMQEVRAKIQLLETLGDIQLGMQIIGQDEVEKSREEKERRERGEIRNPIDTHYEKMSIKLEPLDEASADYKLLENYIQSTHAATHSLYNMKVENIFVCEKDSLPFQDDVGNRMLLFHGSRLSNFAGILSQVKRALRI